MKMFFPFIISILLLIIIVCFLLVFLNAIMHVFLIYLLKTLLNLHVPCLFFLISSKVIHESLSKSTNFTPSIIGPLPISKSNRPRNAPYYLKDYHCSLDGSSVTATPMTTRKTRTTVKQKNGCRTSGARPAARSVTESTARRRNATLVP